MKNKLFAIYMCSLVIVISIVLPLAFPVLAIVSYDSDGSIVILILTILVEPFAIAGSYMLLTNVKNIYNVLRML